MRTLRHMKAKRRRFPMIVKRGSCTVKVYRDRKPSGSYYRVVYHLGGKRHRLNYHDQEKAIADAEAKASQLSRGDIDAVQLSGRDRLIYGRALEALRVHEVALDAVATEYSEARKLLDGVSLVEAANFYARHHRNGVKPKSLRDAIAEMIETKESAGVSELYLADLRYRLGVFQNTFQCDVKALVPDDVKGFFDRLRLSPRSYNNFIRTLRTFFTFAQNQGWLSKETELL